MAELELPPAAVVFERSTFAAVRAVLGFGLIWCRTVYFD
jgi:hypothetical protein